MEGFPKISAELAVAADPANVTELCGTHEDILIPSSCFNCTVSGLISRTFLRDDIFMERFIMKNWKKKIFRILL